jgi:hypothetical protein
MKSFLNHTGKAALLAKVQHEQQKAILAYLLPRLLKYSVSKLGSRPPPKKSVYK